MRFLLPCYDSFISVVINQQELHFSKLPAHSSLLLLRQTQAKYPVVTNGIQDKYRKTLFQRRNTSFFSLPPKMMQPAL